MTIHSEQADASRYFENANISIHINNDLKVNGTLTLFDFSGSQEQATMIDLLRRLASGHIKERKGLIKLALDDFKLNVNDPSKGSGTQFSVNK